MEQRQDLSPDLQILLIAEDVDEVKELVKKLEGTVATIHVALVGDIARKDHPGILEELRALSKHSHPEIGAMRTEMRIAGGVVTGAVVAFEIVMRLWK